MECKDVPTNEEISNALMGNINELWNLLSTLEGDSEFNKAKEQAKNGVKIEFNIEFVNRGYVEEYPDSHNVKIRGYKKFGLEKYWEEIRQRERIMRNMLRSVFDNGNQEEWND
jgi:hypothetical protein